MRLMEWMLGRKRVLVNENERVLHFWQGQIKGILRPGEHVLKSRRNGLMLETHTLSHAEFVSTYEKALFDRLPDVAAEHFTVVQTGAGEVAVVERDGKIHAVIGPDARRVFWTDAGPWSFEIFDTNENPQIDRALAQRLNLERKLAYAKLIAVGDGQAGLLFIDGAFERQLAPGLHAFWATTHTIQHVMVDLRRRSMDVSGQEILTKDRVTLRVNIAADYQVIDPVKAVTEVKDFADALYRALQVAFRKTIGAMTLDQLLDRTMSIDTAAIEAVKADMRAIGLEVSDIALKDVILPGDMREILNQVVAAAKEAEANVIRRREETNATRSLLNTAKVMADNPVMLRLKELEALETVAQHVDSITVHSGTDGLLNDLVKLRET